MDVVFDLGGVLLAWKPEVLVADLVIPPSDRGRILDDVIGHADWRELDRGTLDREEAIGRAISRTRIPRHVMEQFFAAVPTSLVPMPETVELLRELRAADIRLFYLSNMHRASATVIRATSDIWPLFEGGLFSCDVRSIKPEEAIYRIFLDRFGLTAANTLFIDDMAQNIAGAERCGMNGHLFRDADSCRRALCSAGILASDNRSMD